MSREVITEAEAIKRGLKTFFTGRPCKRGHIAPRYVSDGYCVECNKHQEDRGRGWHGPRCRR